MLHAQTFEKDKQMTISALEASETKSRFRHNDSDSEIKRNRILRWAVAGIAAVIITFIPGILIGYTLASIIPISGIGWLGFFLGIASGLYVLAYVFPRYFLIRVGQVRCFVTLNPLLSFFGIKGNPNITYGPGDNIAFPWEERSRKGNVPLDIITLDWEENVPGKTTQLLVKGSYQFKPDITMASRFIGVDDSTILGGVIDLIESKVSSILATKSADSAKREIDKLNIALGAYFGIETDEPSLEVSNFEQGYGIHSVQVTVSSIDLPAHVQKTRDAVDEAEQVLRGVAKMYGMSTTELKQKVSGGKISIPEYNNMLDRFAATSDNATMDVKAIKLDGLNEVARVFGEAFGKMLSSRQATK